MKQAFIYQDDKTSKFWWIDYSEFDFVVNFGKTGTIGKFQLKEFDSVEECEKEANKIIKSKLKKGYSLQESFDFDKHYYFDDEEYGLHPKTTHPKFIANFKNALYFDCADEEAPFGSDDGSDTLRELESYLRKNKQGDLFLFPKIVVTKYWDMEFIPPSENLTEELLQKQLEEKEDGEMLIYQSDQVLVAVALGQIKIMGRINPALKRAALLALKRIQLLAQIKEWGFSETTQQIFQDLEAFQDS